MTFEELRNVDIIILTAAFVAVVAALNSYLWAKHSKDHAMRNSETLEALHESLDRYFIERGQNR